MITRKAKGNWNKLKGRFKQKYALVTKDHLLLEEGKEDEIFGELLIMLGSAKEELHNKTPEPHGPIVR